MSFVLGIFGAIIGVFIALLIIVFVILKIIQKKLGVVGMNPISSLKKVSDEAKIANSTTHKSVNGMTTLIEPVILEDFADFNKDLIFSLIESNLKTIFSGIENLELEKLPELELLNNSLEKNIEDLKEQNVKIKYDNVVFHRHALKRYEKQNGVATITTSSTLEYNYYDSRRKENSSLKTQTRYTCKFVYIYDIDKIPKNSSNAIFIFHCPNCGAPLDKLKNASCVYCGSHIEEVNLKTWKMSYFKNDYIENYK